MEATKRLKITVVGDGMVGKTTLIDVFSKNELSEEYNRPVFEKHLAQTTVDGEEIELELWYTAGQEDYEKLRPISYTHTDCFLVCYSVSSRASFENVLHKWYPELQHFSQAVPIVLVATKTDLRTSDFKKDITTQEGKKMMDKIRAVQLVECSALEKLNINQVFEEAVRAALKPKTQTHTQTKQRTCNYL